VKKAIYSAAIVLLWALPWALPLLFFRLMKNRPVSALLLSLLVLLGLGLLIGGIMEKIKPTLPGHDFDDAGGTIPRVHNSRFESPFLILTIPTAIAVVCFLAWYFRK